MTGQEEGKGGETQSTANEGAARPTTPAALSGHGIKKPNNGDHIGGDGPKNGRWFPKYIKPAEWVMIVFTAITAVAAWAGVYVANGQLAAMVDSSDQTNRAIAESHRLADLAADAIGQSQGAANVTHNDTQAALGESDVANSISRRTALANQRAWVYPTLANMNGGLVKGDGFKVLIQYVNGGHEPAENFVPAATYLDFTKESWNSGKAPLDIQKTANSCFKGSPGRLDKRSVFPTIANSNYYMQIDTSKPKEATKVIVGDDEISGDKIIAIEGCLLYRSIGATHHTAFCYFYQTGYSIPPALNICPTGNDAD